MYRLILYLVVASVIYQSCSRLSSKEGMVGYQEDKICGVSFVAANEPIDYNDFEPVVDLNATWVSLMPYAFLNDSKLHFNTNRQWWGETKSGIISMVNQSHAYGLHVMLKPQVWIRHGAFTGHYQAPDEEGWQELEQSYRAYMLHYAGLADSLHVEIFCIGTEWATFIVARPDFWHELIGDVRKIYSGKLTYAANWDEYMSIPFWLRLDYIGINAYFPLSDTEMPTPDMLREAWRKPLDEMESASRKFQKPVLFTEYGYRSVPHAAKEPWVSGRSDEVSLPAQTTAYQALYATVWGKPWLAGGFLWKWYHNHETMGGELHSGFTPQNKPAEEVIRDQYFMSK